MNKIKKSLKITTRTKKENSERSLYVLRVSNNFEESGVNQLIFEILLRNVKQKEF